MEELLGRRVPYSGEAEQSILGSMLIDPVCIPDVVNKVKASEFYIDTNREIFETIFSMFSLGQRVDPVTVLDQMKVRGCWKDTSQQYLFELMDITPTAANVLEYCAIVRERALLRKLGTAASEISDMVYGGTGEAQQALELAERKIYALRKENTAGGLVPLTQVLQDVMHQISEAAAQGSKVPGLTTGLTDIDEALMGLGPGDLVLIASRPGMGKTSIALNMAVSAAKASGKTVAIFSLEMSRQQLVMRLLAAESHRTTISSARAGSLPRIGAVWPRPPVPCPALTSALTTIPA
jgi:replicative DNA helicase